MTKTMFRVGMVLLIAAISVAAVGQGTDAPARTQLVPTVIKPVFMDVSPPFRELKPILPRDREEMREEEAEPPVIPPRVKAGIKPLAPTPDPVLQSKRPELTMPSPSKSWDGIPNVYGYTPPDTNGDVGLNYYMQWVNVNMAIWDKNGNLVWGPYDGNTIWQGFGGPADSCNDGDPVVLYDQLANRWFISQFAYCASGSSGPFYQYIAVSVTSDPTGAWYRYAYAWPNNKFNDYPKFGVWPDGYYMTANQFNFGTGTWMGAGVAVFDRAKMLAGDSSASAIYFDLASVDINYGNILPTNFQGATAPPSGAPNPFISFDDDAWGYPNDQIDVWLFHVDWTTPSNTTFGLNGNPNTALTTAPFDSNMCGYSRNCIGQPGTYSGLDAISDRPMYRLQYRNMGSYQALVFNHTVDADATSHAGIRWYELRNPGSGWTIYQQGTFAPDSDNRWMGSAAMDHNGDIAIGYSVSGASTYPSVRYAGRLASDPPGVMTQGEASLIAGGGSQLSSYHRWGDYSTLSVDPADDCTFWYTQQYYASTSTAGWSTRIGAFKFPGCGSSAFSVTAGGNPTSGYVPLTVSFTASASGGTAPYTYSWNFGDGTTGSGAAVSHTYTSANTYTATVTATDSASSSDTASVTVTVTVQPPVITSVTKAGAPFRLKILGSNFHSNCTVYIDGVPVPQVTYKNATKLVAKGGSSLKAMVPKGVTVQVTVKNNDDGGMSNVYPFTR